MRSTSSNRTYPFSLRQYLTSAGRYFLMQLKYSLSTSAYLDLSSLSSTYESHVLPQLVATLCSTSSTDLFSYHATLCRLTTISVDRGHCNSHLAKWPYPSFLSQRASP